MSTDRTTGELARDSSAKVSRRAFLSAGVAVGGGLLVGVSFATVSEPPLRNAMDPRAGFAPDAFIRIDRQGQVTLTVASVEMGQGTYTSIPMLIAEELEVELAFVRVEHAPPNDKLYANGLLGFQVTGNSTSIRSTYEPMRQAGANARMLIVQAAANQWGAETSACYAERGTVIHTPTGRRLAYGAVVDDAARLPLPQNVALKPPSVYRLIGTATPRLDTPGKVNGSAIYGIDATVPGLRFAALMQAPAYGGRLMGMDDRKAKAIPGVRQVVKLDDCVAVVADHTGAARKGLAALDLQWDAGPNANVGSSEIVAAMKKASSGPAVTALHKGNVPLAMSQAQTRLDAIYQLPFLAHAAMEPMNCTAHVTQDHCEVWVGTQALAQAQAIAAKACGLPLEKVTVHNHLLGGGFGRRLDVDGVERAVQIAQRVDGPLKVIWSREEDIRRDLYRPCFYDRITAGLDASGQLLAWSHRITGSSIIKRKLPAAFKNGFDRDTIDGAAEPPYAFANMLVEYVNHEPPQIPTAFWRSVGASHNIFVVESFVDELAHTAKKDPAAYRLAMLEKNPRAKRVLQHVLEKSSWGSPLPARQGRGLSVQSVFGTYMAQVAELEVSSNGEVKIMRVVCAVDCGVVINPDTVRAQIEGAIIFGISAALYGEITIKNGQVEQSNFHDYRPLRIDEAPAIETHILQSSNPPGGMGEPGTSCIAPAVTNAIFAATGKRLRQLPIGEQLKATP